MTGKTVEVCVVSESAGGFVASGFIFVGITAIWAILVRDDPFYGPATLFGVTAPFATIAYLSAIPLLGFLFGRWTYHHLHAGGALTFAAKLVARAVHFTYAHLLIVLFTVAILTDRLMGLNIDDQVRTFDDVLFEALARYAPWLSAYLAGFNFGRATVVRKTVMPAVSADAAVAEEIYLETNHAEIIPPAKSKPSNAEKPAKKEREPKPARQAKAQKPARADRGRQKREEPIVENNVFLPSDAAETVELTPGAVHDSATDGRAGAQSQTLSGLPQPDRSFAGGAPAETGFLPPQDFERLRPTLRQLR
jgi:hypothetical protein